MTNDLVKRLRDTRYDGQLMMRVTAADRIEELENTVDLRWECDRRAIKQWREAHPGNDRVWPDHVDLCMWLMEKVEELENNL